MTSLQWQSATLAPAWATTPWLFPEPLSSPRRPVGLARQQRQRWQDGAASALCGELDRARRSGIGPSWAERLRSSRSNSWGAGPAAQYRHAGEEEEAGIGYRPPMLEAGAREHEARALLVCFGIEPCGSPPIATPLEWEGRKLLLARPCWGGPPELRVLGRTLRWPGSGARALMMLLADLVSEGLRLAVITVNRFDEIPPLATPPQPARRVSSTAGGGARGGAR